jgi:hypothetical protein
MAVTRNTSKQGTRRPVLAGLILLAIISTWMWLDGANGSLSASASSQSRTIGLAGNAHAQPATNDPRVADSPDPGGTAYAHLNPSGLITVTMGSKFTFNLIVNSGTDSSVYVTGAQNYITYTNSVLQNVNVGASGCVYTSTVTPDVSTFDAVLQNEVCNGPAQCNFRGRMIDPGSLAFASGVLSNPPAQGDFRVAQIAFCAIAQGDALIHWQFAPPDPATRDSFIVDSNSNVASNRVLYTDSVVHVVAPGPILVGHVTWQGRPAQPNTLQRVPITLTLKAGTTEVNYPSQNTDSSGFFTTSLGNLPNGTYSWRVKDPKYLANVGNVALTGSPTNAEMGLMRAGDANNDNLVSVLDFNILKSTFGKSVGQTGYDDRADFTGDQVITILDFNSLKGNFGLGGSPPTGVWGP